MAARGLISFDAAGTLIQVARPVAQTYAEIAGGHGVPVTAEALKPAFRTVWSQLPAPLHPEGTPAADDDRYWWKELVRRVFAAARGEPVDEEVLSPLFDELYQHYAKPEAWIVYDDVLPALNLLREDFDLCVLSNFDRRLYSILEGHGLTPYFKTIVISSEVGASKPHPRMFAEAERRMNANAAEILHTGDDEKNDLLGAQNAGWKAWHVQRPQADLQILAEKVLSGSI
ncbi:MAG: HAD-IA family hydrolase [Verrucomicrobiota bacterium]